MVTALNCFVVIFAVPIVFLDVVVVIFPDERVVLTLLGNVVVDVLVELVCLNVLLVSVGCFFSVEVVAEDVVVDDFCMRTFGWTAKNVDNVAFDVILPNVFA